MKKLLALLITGSLLLSVTWGGLASAQAELRIATIDLDQVFKGYYETKRAESVINERLAEYKKGRGEKQDALRKLQEDIEAIERETNDPTISAEKRAERLKEIENKKTEGRRQLQEFNDYCRNMEQELSLVSERRRKEILDKIRKVIDQKAREQTFNFVFDVSGQTSNNVPVILFSDTRTDITQDVLTILNRDAPSTMPSLTPERPTATP
jgi:outer membrane protein